MDTETSPAQVETIPLAEVEQWLKDHIQPYINRIENLERVERKKDSQISSLYLALESLKHQLEVAKKEHSAHLSTIKRPVTSSGPVNANGIKRPATAIPDESKKEEPKRIIKQAKPSAPKTDPKDKPEDSKQEGEELKQSVIEKKPVEKKPVKPKDDKIPPSPAVEKKPAKPKDDATAAKEDKNTKIKQPAIPVERKPANTIKSFPKEASKDPKEAKEVKDSHKDDKKTPGGPHKVTGAHKAPGAGGKGKAETKKEAPQQEEEKNDAKEEVLPTDEQQAEIKAELQAEIKAEQKKETHEGEVNAVEPEVAADSSVPEVDNQVHQDEQLLGEVHQEGEQKVVPPPQEDEEQI